MYVSVCATYVLAPSKIHDRNDAADLPQSCQGISALFLNQETNINK